ncbi:MAG: TetR/AcrR family transcriptional regulator [Thermodesulfobacteriota bacterium]
MENRNHSETYEKLVLSAEKLFAAKGFYGTSIRDVAQSLSIAKSSVLHHFPRKEKLYAVVLQRIADDMTRELQSIRSDGTDEFTQMLSFIALMCENTKNRPDRDLIILRELLDNPNRADKARKWYFAPYLNELSRIVSSGMEKGLFKPVNPGLFVFHLLGAHHYFIICLPTVRKLFEAAVFDRMVLDHRRELEKMVEDKLARPRKPKPQK